MKLLSSRVAQTARDLATAYYAFANQEASIAVARSLPVCAGRDDTLGRCAAHRSTLRPRRSDFVDRQLLMAGLEQHRHQERDERSKENPPRKFHHRQPAGLRVEVR